MVKVAGVSGGGGGSHKLFCHLSGAVRKKYPAKLGLGRSCYLICRTLITWTDNGNCHQR